MEPAITKHIKGCRENGLIVSFSTRKINSSLKIEMSHCKFVEYQMDVNSPKKLGGWFAIYRQCYMSK